MAPSAGTDLAHRRAALGASAIVVACPDNRCGDQQVSGECQAARLILDRASLKGCSVVTVTADESNLDY